MVLKVFSSSKFHHGETVAQVGDNYYKQYHSKIYKTDASGTINYDDEHHPTNVKPLDISIYKECCCDIPCRIIDVFSFQGSCNIVCRIMAGLQKELVVSLSQLFYILEMI